MVKMNSLILILSALILNPHFAFSADATCKANFLKEEFQKIFTPYPSGTPKKSLPINFNQIKSANSTTLAENLPIGEKEQELLKQLTLMTNKAQKSLDLEMQLYQLQLEIDAATPSDENNYTTGPQLAELTKKRDQQREAINQVHSELTQLANSYSPILRCLKEINRTINPGLESLIQSMVSKRTDSRSFDKSTLCDEVRSEKNNKFRASLRKSQEAQEKALSELGESYKGIKHSKEFLKYVSARSYGDFDTFETYSINETQTVWILSKAGQVTEALVFSDNKAKSLHWQHPKQFVMNTKKCVIEMISTSYPKQSSDWQSPYVWKINNEICRVAQSHDNNSAWPPAFLFEANFQAVCKMQLGTYFKRGSAESCKCSNGTTLLDPEIDSCLDNKGKPSAREKFKSELLELGLNINQIKSMNNRKTILNDCKQFFPHSPSPESSPNSI